MSFDGKKVFRWLAVSAVLLVVLAGGWVRLSRLAASPWFQADEAYYGLQVVRLLQGDSIEPRTTSGNVLSPLMVASQLPFTLISGASIWAIRIPPALSGLLTALGLYLVFRDRLGHRPAALAGLLYLVLPPAIEFGRVGCEYSQSPLIGLAAIGLAWSRRPIAAVACLGLALLVHPTNVLLACVVGPILLTTWCEPRDRRATTRYLGAAATLLAVLGVFAILMRGNSNIEQQLSATRAPGVFLENLGQFLLGMKQEPGPKAIEVIRWTMWGALPLATVVVLNRLLKRGDWRRLSLLGGWVAALAAFDLAAGAEVIADVAMRRYGAVLLVPTALAIALIAEEMLLRQLNPATRPTRRLAVGLVLCVVGLALPAAYLVNEYAGNRVAIQNHLLGPFEPDPYSVAARQIEATFGPPTSGPPKMVVAQYEFQNGLQMEYLLSGRRDLKVVPLLGLLEVWQLRTDPAADPLRPRRDRLAEALKGGGIALSLIGSTPDFGAGQIDRAIAEHFPGASQERNIILPQQIIRVSPLAVADRDDSVDR